MNDDDKMITTKECKTLCQTLLNADQTVSQDSFFNDDLFKRVCQRIHNKNEVRIIRNLKSLHKTSKDWIFIIRAQTSFNLLVASLSYSLVTSSLKISCLSTLLAVLTCSELQSRYVDQQERDLHYVSSFWEIWSRLDLYQTDWIFTLFEFPLIWDCENLQNVCDTDDRVSSVIFNSDLIVDQTYSQFLFQKKISLILLLIYMYETCCHVEQLCIFSSWSFASTRSLSWIDLFFACEAFLEEVVHFSLSSCWLDTVALSDEKADSLMQCL